MAETSDEIGKPTVQSYLPEHLAVVEDSMTKSIKEVLAERGRINRALAKARNFRNTVRDTRGFTEDTSTDGVPSVFREEFGFDPASRFLRKVHEEEKTVERVARAVLASKSESFRRAVAFSSIPQSVWDSLKEMLAVEKRRIVALELRKQEREANAIRAHTVSFRRGQTPDLAEKEAGNVYLDQKTLPFTKGNLNRARSEEGLLKIFEETLAKGDAEKLLRHFHGGKAEHAFRATGRGSHPFSTVWRGDEVSRVSHTPGNRLKR